jgi:hypothetical protein
MGFIGMGKQMGGLINKFLQYPEIEVVAVCDVYAFRREMYQTKVERALRQEWRHRQALRCRERFPSRSPSVKTSMLSASPHPIIGMRSSPIQL